MPHWTLIRVFYMQASKLVMNGGLKAIHVHAVVFFFKRREFLRRVAVFLELSGPTAAIISL